jgi:hypothetical protein
MALFSFQPQAAASLNVHQRAVTELTAANAGPKGLRGGEELAAVVSKGMGHGSLPAAEVVGVNHSGQPVTKKRILP